MSSESTETKFKDALGSAIASNRPRRVRSLLARGCSPDSKVWRDWDTGLFLAVRLNRVEIARILLDAGASPHPSSTGRDPLVDAMRKNSMELVDLLLERGGIVADKPTEPNGFTAPEIAVLSDRPVLLQRLLDAGVDPSVCIHQCFPMRGWPRIRRPSRYQAFELLYLARAAKHRGRIKRRERRSRLIEFVPLVLAAIAGGSHDCAHVLIERGADKTAKDSDGFGMKDYLKLQKNARPCS